MATIYLTQFLRPNGEKRQISFQADDAIAAKVKVLESAGYRLECEVLTTGLIHIDCCNDEEQLAMTVALNDNTITEKTIVMIEKAYLNLIKKDLQIKVGETFNYPKES